MDILIILLCAVLFGITKKLADLFNEHGLRWFKGDAILFGFLWGIFGALLVLADIDISNIILAMVIAYLIRARIDYRNHAIAAAIIIISFMFFSTLEPVIFLAFLAAFTIFGMLKDYLGDVRKKKDVWFMINERSFYYYIFPLIFSIYTAKWIVFAALAIHMLAYDLTKYFGMKAVKNKKSKPFKKL